MMMGRFKMAPSVLDCPPTPPPSTPAPSRGFWATPASECRGKRRRTPDFTLQLDLEALSRSRPRQRRHLHHQHEQHRHHRHAQAHARSRRGGNYAHTHNSNSRCNAGNAVALSPLKVAPPARQPPRDERNMSLTINVAATQQQRNPCVVATPLSLSLRPSALPARRKRPPTPPLARGRGSGSGSSSSKSGHSSGNSAVGQLCPFAALAAKQAQQHGARRKSPCNSNSNSNSSRNAGSSSSSSSRCCQTTTPRGLTLLDAAAARPLSPSPRRKVRFGFGVKRNDGPCLRNRFFDDLVWTHVGITAFNTPEEVIDVARVHLEQEAAMCRSCDDGDGDDVSSPCPHDQLSRLRATSAASTDSDDSSDSCDDTVSLPSLSGLLHAAHALTRDLVNRIHTAAAESSPDTSVPVLPRGGGFAAKLSLYHVQHVDTLQHMLRLAIASVAMPLTPAAAPVPSTCSPTSAQV